MPPVIPRRLEIVRQQGPLPAIERTHLLANAEAPRAASVCGRLQAALAASRNACAAPAMLRALAAMRATRDANSSESAPRLAWGVDGCPAGWFYVALDGTGEWCCGVAGSLAEIIEAAEAGDRVLVDIHIGLPDASCPRRRECDSAARRRLNRDQFGNPLPAGERRGASVFPAPAREALGAKSYEEACAMNRTAIGMMLSQQAAGLLGKVREADELMRNNAKARRIVREAHPELCFWALNGERPMRHSKKGAPGRHGRLAVLAQCWPQAKPACGDIGQLYLRKQVAHDDILDAMALAVIARASKLRSLPETPPRDAEGLPMQVTWASKDAIRITAG